MGSGIIRLFICVGIVNILLFQNCSMYSPARDLLSDNGEIHVSAAASATAAKQLLIDSMSQVKSVTWYTNYGDGASVGIRNPEASAAEFVQELPRIKAAGFNTVWISDHTTWAFLQPNPQAYGEGFDKRELELLKYMLSAAKSQGLKVMLPINGYGYGHWHSSNSEVRYWLRRQGGQQGQEHDLCTWFDPSTHSNVWTWYVYYVYNLLYQLYDYHDMIYFFVYSEAGYDDLGNRCQMTQDFYSNVKSALVRSSYGNLPAILQNIDSELMKRVVMGYHDDHAISDAWVENSNLPINPESKFDYISTHAYYDGYDQYPYSNSVYLDTLGFYEIGNILHKRLQRLRDASPQSKVFLGEFGISNCRHSSVPLMVSVYDSIRYFLYQEDVGFNMWAWMPVYANDENLCGGATGGYYLTSPFVDGKRPFTPFAEAIFEQ